MKITTKKLPKSQIELYIEVDSQELKPYLDRAAAELSKNINLPGFRAGKVPREVLEQHLGKQKVLEEAIKFGVPKFYVKAIMEENIEAIGKPKITVIQAVSGSALKFRAITAVIPEVDLADYKQISRKEKVESPTLKEKEVKDALEWLRNSRAKLTFVKRPARKGDRVEVDFESRLGGVKIDQGQSKNHPLIIGQNKFIPGFEEKIIGMKSGQTRQFQLAFPKNHPKKDLAGKLVDFKVKMKLVQDRVLPALDDKFAKNLGNFKDLEALKAGVRQGLKQELERRAAQKWRIKVIEKVAENSKMEIPEVLKKTELEKMLEELKDSVKQMGLGFKRYLEKTNLCEEELKEKWQDQALSRVKISLVLREIAKKESISPQQEEIEEKINEILKNHPIKDAKNNLDSEQLKQYAKGLLRNEKVFEFLEKNRKI